MKLFYATILNGSLSVRQGILIGMMDALTLETSLSQIKSSILFSQTASHLHIKIRIKNNVCVEGKTEKHSLSSCLP